MGSVSTSGKDVASNEGAGYGVKVFVNSNDPDNVMDPTLETESWILRAHPQNEGIIYLGWDEDVTTENGFPLSAGDASSMDMDNSKQVIYAVADTAGDELRYIATS
jgi:hypothetical protein